MKPWEDFLGPRLSRAERRDCEKRKWLWVGAWSNDEDRDREEWGEMSRG